MQINEALTKHPMFTVADAEYLKGRGKTDAKILADWEFNLAHGQWPNNRQRQFDLKTV